jgi:hypothetical protein
LAELIGNAAIPFPNGRADPGHTLNNAATGSGTEWRLDIAARMFGYLHGGRVFAGLVRFTDGVLQGTAKEIGPFKIVVGQPRPDSHKPFYPDDRRRKFYHHHVDANGLVPAPSSITQTRIVRPLPPGTRFTFQVHFENLREEELNLLLYCLVLEENVTVTLSQAALGPDAREPVTLTGPMRHKFGGCKPQGGGSVQITIDKMMLYADRADRYRGQAALPRTLEGKELESELQRRTRDIAARQDNTMQHLRAMLIYSRDDPRRPIEYPSYDWFNDSQKSSQPLKPTL